MPPRHKIAAAAALVVLFSCDGSEAQTPAAPSAPNVILIVADDVGVDLVNVYAREYEVPPPSLPCTPRLDELAAKGVRFTNAWSSLLPDDFSRWTVALVLPSLRRNLADDDGRGDLLDGRSIIDDLRDD